MVVGFRLAGECFLPGCGPEGKWFLFWSWLSKVSRFFLVVSPKVSRFLFSVSPPQGTLFLSLLPREGPWSWRIPLRGPRDEYLLLAVFGRIDPRRRAGRETEMRGLVFSSFVPADVCSVRVYIAAMETTSTVRQHLQCVVMGSPCMS